MLFVGTSIIHPSTEGVFLLCNILDLLIYRSIFKVPGFRKEKNKNNDESICQDVVWYSKEKIKKSKENINKLYQPRKIVTGRTLTIK